MKNLNEQRRVTLGAYGALTLKLAQDELKKEVGRLPLTFPVSHIDYYHTMLLLLKVL